MDADKKAEEIADMATEYDAQFLEQQTYDDDVETILQTFIIYIYFILVTILLQLRFFYIFFSDIP